MLFNSRDLSEEKVGKEDGRHCNDSSSLRHNVFREEGRSSNDLRSGMFVTVRSI